MDKDRPIYVIDTNVVIDYEDIIPSPDAPGKKLDEPTVDLSHAHLVIPTVVIRELSKFKGEKTERGKTARAVLKRLRSIFEDNVKPMSDVYSLDAPVTIGDQMISILPVHKNFKKCLPFEPSDADMDGQIILTALAVQALQREARIDGGSHIWYLAAPPMAKK